jgi:hypothetical protein
MPEHSTAQDLRDRLDLIERMLAEGRRTTESWGWIFVLWGITYYIAMAWSAWSRSGWAWPVTTLIAVVVTAGVASLRTGHHQRTTLGRAIGSIWIALGISMFLLFMALGLSGRLTDPRLFMACISAILGLANGASGLALRWKIQLACAVVWWVAAVAVCFVTIAQGTLIFLIAVFLCQVVFGIYGMVAEGQARKRCELVHA